MSLSRVLAAARARALRLAGVVRRNVMSERFDEEMKFHIDMAADRNRERGLREHEAERVARIAFGGRPLWTEAARDQYRSRALDDLGQDFRYAARTLRSSPAFTIAAVLTLAIGIGGNTAIFSAVDGVMLKPLPFTHADRLVRIYESNRKKSRDRDAVAPADFADWHARASAFAALATIEPFGYALPGKEGMEQIRNWNVTQDFFAVLDAKPYLGRLLEPADFVPGPPQAIVLTYASWQNRFGANPNVVGTHLSLSGVQTTIVGVLPRDFSYLSSRTPQEFYAPKVLDSIELRLHGDGWYHAVGRLKPDVTIEQANVDLNRVAVQIGREFPRTNGDVGTVVIPLRDGIVGNSARALSLSLAAVGLVLLIACSNVANLMLARTARRGREFALRTALGAGRGRIVRQVLTESFVIALLGAAAGLALSQWGVATIRALSPESIARVDEMRLDGRAFAFALATVVVTTFLFGLVPAIRAAEPGIGDELKAGGRSAGSAKQRRLRGILVAAEVSLAIVLLVSAGLLVRSFASLLSVDRGYQSDHVLASLVFTWGEAQTPTARFQLANRLVERASALPGVKVAGATSSAPLTGSIGVDKAPFTIVGQAVTAGQAPSVRVASVTPSVFSVLRIPILRGRGFTADDDSARQRVAVVSESMARRYWPGENAIGRHIRIGFYSGPIEREIVGVVADAKQSALDVAAEPAVYLPNAQAPTGALWLVMRTAIEPHALEHDVRRLVAELNPGLPIAAVQSFDDILADSLKPRRFTLALFVAFAGVAMVLAIVGVYGVLNHGVAERAREIGVRIALGAAPGDIVRLVMVQGLGAASAGILVGLGVSFLATRLLRDMLYTVGPVDAVTFAGVSAIMLATASLASYLPARRATRLDPLIALRDG